jgi:hypothetical protein
VQIWQSRRADRTTWIRLTIAVSALLLLLEFVPSIYRLLPQSAQFPAVVTFLILMWTLPVWLVLCATAGKRGSRRG